MISDKRIKEIAMAEACEWKGTIAGGYKNVEVLAADIEGCIKQALLESEALAFSGAADWIEWDAEAIRENWANSDTDSLLLYVADQLRSIHSLPDKGDGNAEEKLREENKRLVESVAHNIAKLAGYAEENFRLQTELDEAKGYAERLFLSVHPECESLGYLCGILTQIDNAWAGAKTRAEQAEAERQADKEAIKRKDDLLREALPHLKDQLYDHGVGSFGHPLLKRIKEELKG